MCIRDRVSTQSTWGSEAGQFFKIQRTEEELPVHKLGPENPILFYTELHLFDDDLGDCGLSTSNFRFRVMEDSFFGLLRFYLRVDDVIVRVYDTRIYHDFSQNYIYREFNVRENSYQELRAKGFKFDAEFNLDPKQSDLIYKTLDSVLVAKEKIILADE
eukprot:TRINITY_DN3401_c0_g1_i2.p1 TRINITY_DN3401_c0_g1~~TRINITY_DN3401_c0_g1_i2.p1  ORF type:complete len:159 (+),score=29.93 TRINITY_DN3401_c0_g1_i2:66-542(+)